LKKAVSLTLSVILNILLVLEVSKLITVKEKEKLEEEVVISLSEELNESKKTSPSLVKREKKDIHQEKRKSTVKKRKVATHKRKVRKRVKSRIKKHISFNGKERREKEEEKETKLKGHFPIKEVKEEGTGRKEKKSQESNVGKGEKTNLKEEDKKEKSSSSFDLEAYKSKVIEVIEREKFYPPLARRLGIEGEVKVLLTIGRKGELLKVETLSGNRILREATVKILKRCKFPPLPESFKGKEVRLELSICYKLY